ncbi:hypothetical protein [Oceanospirillum sanctuarii]|uniref:hypothetical protein n=1 Tax=Oceanospirillum sanctuarii TaxID=1434821 RepID=UPI001120A740|nr:hypothetical protein [Oceanospirillum sanctuarii]
MWPIVADLYTPLLVLMVFWIAYQAGQLKPAVILLSVSLLLVFGFSALELKLGIWHSWGLDFSTHTAILLPFYQMLVLLVVLPTPEPDKQGMHSLILHLKAFMALMLALVAGVGYGALMMQLGYHTFADILTTVISTYPLVWISFRLMRGVSVSSQQTEEAV